MQRYLYFINISNYRGQNIAQNDVLRAANVQIHAQTPKACALFSLRILWKPALTNTFTLFEDLENAPK